MSEVGSDSLGTAAVADAPASTPDASTSSTTTTAEAPKSFREALDAWDQKPPSPQSTPNGPDPAVTGDGAESAAAAASDPIEARISEERAKWDAEQKASPWHAIQESFDPQEFAGAVEQLRLMQTDPRAFYESFGRELKQAGLLPDAPAPAPKPFTMPEADLQAEDGTTAYSAERLAEIVQGLQAQIDAKIQPFEQEHQARLQEAEARKTESKAKSIVDEAAGKYEAFNELKPQIVQEMLRDKATGKFRSLEQVYLEVFQKSYLPTRDEKVRQQALADLRAKAAVTTTRPAGGVPRGGQTGPAKSFRDAIERNGGASAAEAVFSR